MGTCYVFTLHCFINIYRHIDSHNFKLDRLTSKFCSRLLNYIWKWSKNPNAAFFSRVKKCLVWLKLKLGNKFMHFHILPLEKPVHYHFSLVVTSQLSRLPSFTNKQHFESFFEHVLIFWVPQYGTLLVVFVQLCVIYCSTDEHWGAKR